MNRKNILIADPDRDVSELFARAIEARKDCKCYLAASEEEVMDLLKDIAFDLLLIDVAVLSRRDYHLLRRIRHHFPDTRVIADAYLHQKEQIANAIRHGAADHIIKPVNIYELRKKIQVFLDQAEMPGCPVPAR